MQLLLDLLRRIGLLKDPLDASTELEHLAGSQLGFVVPGGEDLEVIAGVIADALDMTGNITAQGQHAAATEGFDAFGALVCGIKLRMLHAEGKELLLEPGGGENFVDPDEECALLAIFFRSADLKKGWTKFGLIGDAGHGSKVLD